MRAAPKRRGIRTPGQGRGAIMQNENPDKYLAWAEINLAAVRRNYAAIRNFTHGKELIAVVKSNACGHGAVPVAKTLREAGVKFFAVASVSEALQLREAGIEADILNMGSLAPAEARKVVQNNIVQALFSEETAAALDAADASSGAKARVHIKIDTGLGRFGVLHGDAARFARAVGNLAHIAIEGVFSVLTQDLEFDKTQIERFRTALAEVKETGVSPGLVHLVSSAGVLDWPEAYFDMVRPGIMLLGIYPNTRSWRERKIELEPVLSLKARVARVARISKGESVSYLRKHVVPEDTVIATLNMGYTHGFPRSAPGRAEVLIRGKRCPVIADVPATAVFVDLGLEGQGAEGDEAVIIGTQGGETITVEDLAVAAGISEYQLVTSLPHNLPRVYLDD